MVYINFNGHLRIQVFPCWNHYLGEKNPSLVNPWWIRKFHLKDEYLKLRTVHKLISMLFSKCFFSWKHEPIYIHLTLTCQISMFNGQLFMSTCQIIMSTCQKKNHTMVAYFCHHFINNEIWYNLYRCVECKWTFSWHLTYITLVWSVHGILQGYWTL